MRLRKSGEPVLEFAPATICRSRLVRRESFSVFWLPLPHPGATSLPLRIRVHPLAPAAGPFLGPPSDTRFEFPPLPPPGNSLSAARIVPRPLYQSLQLVACTFSHPPTSANLPRLVD